MEPTPATPPRHRSDDATDPDHDDPGTGSRVTRVDASTRVNEHDQNVDTLLTSASGSEEEHFRGSQAVDFRRGG